MIEIEFEEPQMSVCDCCGKITTRLTRFVNQGDEALAIYYAAFSDGHRDHGVLGIVSFGEWWVDGYVPDSRVAFAFRMWAEDDEYKVGIIDAADSPWADVNIIGRKLTRAEALNDPLIKMFFHITDHMTTDDPAIRDFFETVH